MWWQKLMNLLDCVMTDYSLSVNVYWLIFALHRKKTEKMMRKLCDDRLWMWWLLMTIIWLSDDSLMTVWWLMTFCLTIFIDWFLLCIKKDWKYDEEILWWQKLMNLMTSDDLSYDYLMIVWWLCETDDFLSDNCLLTD